MHDESQGPGIWQLIMSPPDICKQRKTCFETSRVVISDGAQSQGFQTPSFWNKRVFIDHKTPIKAIKPFSLSFFSRSDSYSSIELKQLCLLKNGKQYFCIVVGWTGGRAFGHHSRNGGGAFANKNCPQGRAFDNFFKCPGFARGGGGEGARGCN